MNLPNDGHFISNFMRLFRISNTCRKTIRIKENNFCDNFAYVHQNSSLHISFIFLDFVSYFSHFCSFDFSLIKFWLRLVNHTPIFAARIFTTMLQSSHCLYANDMLIFLIDTHQFCTICSGSFSYSLWFFHDERVYEMIIMEKTE